MNTFFKRLTTSGIAVVALVASTAGALAVLQLRSQGQEVKNVQQLLKDKNFYQGKIDGDFGSGTEKAVKAFQKSKGIPADGKVGASTISLLNGLEAPEPRLQQGAKNDASAVKRLQGYLNKKLGSNMKEDGKFGKETKDAVIKFQKNKGLNPVDGVVGTATWLSLKS